MHYAQYTISHPENCIFVVSSSFPSYNRIHALSLRAHQICNYGPSIIVCGTVNDKPFKFHAELREEYYKIIYRMVGDPYVGLVKVT